MRDSGEHFPAFNVAIRNRGVKKSEKADFLGANYSLECCLRSPGSYVGELDARKTAGEY
jgi:hypothetical protein